MEIHKIYHKELDSTNTEAKRLAEEGAAHGTLVVADRQLAGKGRRGRRWNSPSGGNIYMTLLLRPDLDPDDAPMLTLVMACSVARGIQKQTGLTAQIKWPNDIIVHGKKVCGILTEMSAKAGYIHYVVIGIGINVNTEEFPEELRETATSIRLETGRTFSKNTLIADVMDFFQKDYQIFMKEKNLSGLLDYYNGLLVNRGREVRILGVRDQYNAVASGINPRGELLVKRENGQEETVFAGEVSVRGVYGYI